MMANVDPALTFPETIIYYTNKISFFFTNKPNKFIDLPFLIICEPCGCDLNVIVSNTLTDGRAQTLTLCHVIEAGVNDGVDNDDDDGTSLGPAAAVAAAIVESDDDIFFLVNIRAQIFNLIFSTK